jgi:peptide/nickel transport system substrate-binding protein
VRVAVLLLIVTVAGCSTSPPFEPTPSARAVAGGTLRVVFPAEPQQDGPFAAAEPAVLDPHLDAYFPWYDSWELRRCCVARSLLSANGRSTEEGGSRLQPDLAAAMPDVSADGLAWTFKLRQGVHYGPPLEQVEITAPDFIRSFHRLMSPALEAVDTNYLFADIVGAADYVDGRAQSIAGLESPDRHTLVIRLNQPAGDLASRLSLPVVVPIPPHPSRPAATFGAADGHDDGYGRFLVSSGPYMVEGSEALDFSLPAADQVPLSGLGSGQRITLVRNPAWDSATDPLRPAQADRIELSFVPTADDGVAAIASGKADLFMNSVPDPEIPADVVNAIRVDSTRGQVFINEKDFFAGIMMNLAHPPFDDLHVRRAFSYAVNKANIVEQLGGPLRFRVAHHLVPDSMEDNLLVDYRPYDTPSGAGDIEAAKREMAQSAYDTDGDGICDADACRAIRAMSRGWDDKFLAVAQSVRDDAALIGIELALDEATGFDEFIAPYDDPSDRAAIFIPLGWIKGHPSPSSFFVDQFYSPVALAELGNGSLVGATTAQLREWGYGDVSVPNVDARIEACLPLTGTAQYECWAALDQYMMENVVPSVSYGSGLGVVLGSTRVTGYSWDQLATAPAFDRIELGPEP